MYIYIQLMRELIMLTVVLKKILLLLLLVMGIFRSGNAQEPSYVHFGVEEGLPSSEVYQSIQDQRGYMWFGTDRGLCRFDGYDFKVYTEANGLSGNVVFGFHEDRHHRIWLNLYHEGVNYLVGDSIVVPPFNDSLKKLIGPLIVSSMYIDLQDKLWLSFKNSEKIFTVDSLGTIEIIVPINEKMKCHVTFVDSSGIVFGSKRVGIGNNRVVLLDYGEKEELLYLKDVSEFEIRGFSALHTTRGIYCTQNESIDFISRSGELINQQLPGLATMSITEDRLGNVWVGMYKKGAVCYKNGDLNQPYQHFLTTSSVSSIYIDDSDGVWFTTLYGGVFYAASYNIFTKQYGERFRSEPISALLVNDNKLWIGTKNGQVLKQSVPFSSKEQMVFEDYNEVKQLTRSKHSLIAVIYSPFLVSDELNGEIRVLNTGLIWTDTIGDSIWYHGNYSDEKNKPYAPNMDMIDVGTSHINSIGKCKGKIYLGGRRGLYTIRDYHPISLDTIDLGVNVWITCIATYKDYLFLGTKANGLLIYQDSVVSQIRMNDGILANRIETIYVDNDSIVWLGTKKGLSKVLLSTKFKKRKVENLTSGHGLIDNEINDIVKLEDQIILATNKGISYFKDDMKLGHQTETSIFIEKLLVNNEELPIEKGASLSHESKVFEFQFVALDYKSKGNLKYKYRLKGFDENWTETRTKEVRYMIPPGKYQFEVTAMASNNKWSAVATFPFSVEFPIWQESWFLVFALLLILLSIYLIVAWRFKMLKKQASLELQMVQSQQSALNAQLKPHFIFNALNSIHNFIRKNDVESSTKYLLLFAKLIRQILANSTEPIVTVRQELDLIEKYLEIEQLRFKKRMSYELIIDPTIEMNLYKIPTQLIQPYLENAIWHGIMHKETDGHISLELKLSDQHLICTIEDDGVGREKARSIREKYFEHKSVGMNISSKRLKLVETIFKESVGLEIKDLKNENQQSIGTRVILTLPIIIEQ